jgi:hypothetical protein
VPPLSLDVQGDVGSQAMDKVRLAAALEHARSHRERIAARVRRIEHAGVFRPEMLAAHVGVVASPMIDSLESAERIVSQHPCPDVSAPNFVIRPGVT